MLLIVSLAVIVDLCLGETTSGALVANQTAPLLEIVNDANITINDNATDEVTANMTTVMTNVTDDHNITAADVYVFSNDSQVNDNHTSDQTPDGQSGRLKRSTALFLHSNLDQLSNMRRERRASMRPKRNTNTDYNNLLESLLAAEADNADNGRREEEYKWSHPDDRGLSSYLVNFGDSSDDRDSTDGRDDDNELSQSLQYYYQKLLPLIQRSKAINTEDDEREEVPVIVEPYRQSIPIAYSYPNRYQRIRRSYVLSNGYPVSLYTGLRRKRNRSMVRPYGSQWGRIVGANSDRYGYEDEANEASKIYSLATLMATGNLPHVAYGQNRYKRAVPRTQGFIKNM